MESTHAGRGNQGWQSPALTPCQAPLGTPRVSAPLHAPGRPACSPVWMAATAFAERSPGPGAFPSQLVRRRPSEEADATALPSHRSENRRPERLRSAPAAAQLGHHRAKARTSQSDSRLRPTAFDATEAAASDTLGRGNDPCRWPRPRGPPLWQCSPTERGVRSAPASVNRGAPPPDPWTWVGDLPPRVSVPHLQDAENDLPYGVLLTPK